MKAIQALKICGSVAAAFLTFLGAQVFFELLLILFCSLLYGTVGILPDTEMLLSFTMRNAMAISFLSGLATLTVYLTLPVLFRSSPLAVYDVKPVKLPSAFLLVLFGIAASTVVGVVWEILPFPEWAWEIYNETVADMLAGEDLMTYLAVVLMAPIVEELLCRAVCIGQFSRLIPKWVALLVSSLIFGVMHGNLIQGTYAFVCGLILGLIYLRYGSVTASILFHMGFNAASYLLSLIPEEDVFLSLLAIVLSFAVFAASSVYVFLDTRKQKPEKE